MTARIGRRTVASGAAWSLPALVVSTAAPARAASEVAPTAEVCQSVLLGPYNTASDTYPASFTFGGNVPETQNTITVSVTYPSDSACPANLVGISNPCDGMTGTGGVTCTHPVVDGQPTLQASQPVFGGYFSSQAAQCGSCPFIAVLNSGMPRGATITLDNTPAGDTPFTSEPGPYWSYTFTLSDWGAAIPTVTTVSMSNLDAPLNVVHTV